MDIPLPFEKHARRNRFPRACSFFSLLQPLKKRLQEHGGDGSKAFTEPFHKPKSDGTPGPIVNKVKICEASTLQAPVLRGDGAADNDSMVRIHVAVNTRAKIKEQKRARQSNSLHLYRSL